MEKKNKKHEKTGGWPKGRRPSKEIIKKRAEGLRLATYRRKLLKEFS